MSFQHQRGLILFVRKPELGKVKTRLAADLGEHRALDIYKLLLSHTCQVLAELDAQVYVYYSTEIDQDDLWTEVAHAKKQQSKGDLGNRMLSAFDDVLHSCENVIIIGSVLIKNCFLICLGALMLWQRLPKKESIL